MACNAVGLYGCVNLEKVADAIFALVLALTGEEGGVVVDAPEREFLFRSSGKISGGISVVY